MNTLKTVENTLTKVGGMLKTTKSGLKSDQVVCFIEFKSGQWHNYFLSK